MRVRPHADHGVAKDANIGAAALAIDRIGGVRFAGVEMGYRGRREMSAGGGTHDADAFGIDLPFSGAGTHRTDGALGIFQHARMPVALRTEPIPQNEGADAMLIQVERVILSFMAGQAAIAATGTDHD